MGVRRSGKDLGNGFGSSEFQLSGSFRSPRPRGPRGGDGSTVCPASLGVSGLPGLELAIGVRELGSIWSGFILI